MGYYKKVDGADTFFPFKKEPKFWVNLAYFYIDGSSDTGVYYTLNGIGNPANSFGRIPYYAGGTFTVSGYYSANKPGYTHTFIFTFYKDGVIHYNNNGVEVYEEIQANGIKTISDAYSKNVSLLFY